MKQSIQENIQKEDQVAQKRFTIIMIIAILFGAVLGFLIVFLGRSFITGDKSGLVTFTKIVSPFLQFYILPFILVLLTAIIDIRTRSVLKSCRFALTHWDVEDEAGAKKINQSLSKMLTLSQGSYVIAFCIFGLICYNMVGGDSSIYHLIITFIVIATFLYSLLSFTHVQKKSVNLLKEMNPEKRGSVFDLKFQSKWLESCDEAEQLIIYKSAYKAYRVMTHICLGLTMIFTILGMAFPFGILPLLLSCGLWLVNIVVYNLESMKLEH